MKKSFWVEKNVIINYDSQKMKYRREKSITKNAFPKKLYEQFDWLTSVSSVNRFS